MKKVISFLEDPWVNLITGILGFIGIVGFLFNYSCIKKKRNSPPSGEDK